MQALGQVGDAELVLGLAGDPGPGHDLVVKAGHHAPLAVDLGQAVDDPGGAFHVLLGAVQGVQGAEAALVHQVLDALPNGELAALVDDFLGDAGGLYPVDLGVDKGLDLLDVLAVVRQLVPLLVADLLAKGRHVFKVRMHFGPFVSFDLFL